MEQFGGTKIRPDFVVTGEAVALVVQPASLFLRCIAGIFDAAVSILGVLFSITIYGYVMFLTNTEPLSNEAQMSAAYALLLAFWLVAVPLTIEFLSHGKSLGRFVVGTRVVRDDGGPIAFRHSLVRIIIGLGELWLTLGIAAVIVCSLNRRSKRIGDLFAGTYVISDASTTVRQPLLMPPDMASWAGGATVGNLDETLAIMARRFLQTADMMIPAERQRLSMQLATELQSCVYPQPPLGTDPERFIAAVLVMNRDDEYHFERLVAQQMQSKLETVSAPRYGI